jgi:alpha-glucosidase
MKKVMLPLKSVLCLLLISGIGVAPLRSKDITVTSPGGNVQLKLFVFENGRLGYEVIFNGKAVIEKSPMGITVDNIDLGQSVKIGDVEPYVINETYPWRGVHAEAINHCNGAKVFVTHKKSNMNYTVDVRAFNDGIGFCHILPGDGDRVVSGEATKFRIPEGSTVWHHDFYMHYEGRHTKSDISRVKSGEWAAPPLTFKLPDDIGYASITEAALMNYSGMALQADGQRGFQVRLGHEQPISYPFELRYGKAEYERLKAPAAIQGAIKTPWRVIMIGADLNVLVNCDIIHNLSPAPDNTLFPEGFNTKWLKPGRAVWGFLCNGGRTLEDMKKMSRLAGELGFEYNLVEGHWQRWSLSEQQELVDYSNEHHVKIIFWKHSRDLRDTQKRKEFFKHCQNLGVAGAKIDFFDHEAREIIDLYQACLKEAAEYQLIIDFHGANKPTGESRTWPNEMTREAIKGYESRGPYAKHNTTLPFTRMLAGHADYTPMHFGNRRCETSEAHQIASAIIFTSPLLVYADHPQNILNHKAVNVIKKIPSVWDETIALPVSEISGVAAFARRKGTDWFLAIMNGETARFMSIDFTFLGEGDYNATFVRDQKEDSAPVTLTRRRQRFGSKAGVEIDTTTVNKSRGEGLLIELLAGGGFVALFTK